MEKRMNLAEWGKACAWNNGQRQEMKAYPIKPQTSEDGKMVWIPRWDEETSSWQLGFEWNEPREVAGVEVVYADEEHLPCLQDVQIEYWNTSWPAPMPERWQGARSGWIETEDPRQGKWIWARGESVGTGLCQSFSFDPVDIVEIDDDRRIEWAEEYNVSYRKTLKIRISVKGGRKPVFSSIRVWGTAVLTEKAAEIRFGCNGKQENWSGHVLAFNGSVSEISPIGFDESDQLSGNTWSCHTSGNPKGLRIKYDKSVGSAAQGDQTLITVKAKTRSFTFLASDLEKGAVWIKDYGVLISCPLGENDWKREIEKTKSGVRTIYDRVPKEPEQSYERAAEEIPPLDVTKQAPYGRYTILGWEGVKQKFALRYNGEIFADKRQVKMSGRDTAKVRWAGNEIHFRFGTGDPVDFRQRKDGSKQWMPEPRVPVYITQWQDREIEFTQTAFSVLTDGPVKGPDNIRGDEEITALVRLKIRNTTEGAKKAILCLDVTPAEELFLDGDNLLASGRVAPAETVKDGWKVQPYRKSVFRLHVDKKGMGELKVQPLSEGGVITRAQEIDRYHFSHFGESRKPLPATTHIPNALAYEVELSGFSSHEIDIVIPFTSYSPEEGHKKAENMSFDKKLQEVMDFWRDFYRKGAQIRLPDPTLDSFLKAVPWHILMTANKDPMSQNYMVPAGTYAYDVCGNEACMQTRLLDMLGYHDYAERYLDTFIKTQGAQMPDGNFSSQEGAFVAVSFDAGKMALGKFGYNLDHGFIMTGLAEHYFMTGDEQWLRKVAGSLVKACEFVLRERKATMLTEEDGSRVSCYGLLPMGHLEDNCEWQHWFAVNGQACGGMLRVARALGEINHPEAPRLLREAQVYREDILAALQRAVEESPVVRIPDGSYIPHVPTRTGLRGRDWGWFREAGYGPLHLVDGLVLSPDDERVTWILEDQEDNLFVSRLYGRPVDLEKYWFSQGGVTIQANVLNNGLVYLSRDQISHAVRSLYNNIGQHLYPDVLVFSEHPVAELGSGFGPFFKSPDEAQFLVWLRNFLIREEENTLWICQGAPRKWFEDGKKIIVAGASSTFGKLDFSVESSVSSDFIRAVVRMPDRKVPEQGFIRLRHPDGRPMRKVTVNGENYKEFDAEREIVVLSGQGHVMDITVHF